MLLCSKFITKTENVIKKGGGIRPNEALATLFSIPCPIGMNKEGATF